MHIIYLHQYFNTPEMSGGTRSYEMARRLVEYGHTVDLITADRDIASKKKGGWVVTNEAGINVHWAPVAYNNSMSYYERIMAFFRFAIYSSIKAVSLKADIIFATSTPLTIAIPAIIASKIRRIPMVFEVRDLWPDVPIAIGALSNPILKKVSLWLERQAYRNSKYIVALAPGMKEAIEKKGFSGDTIEVIPNGSDIDLFDVGKNPGLKLREETAWLGNRPLVIFVGTLGYVNGVEYFAHLANYIYKQDENIRFVVIGEGKEGEKVRKLAESYGVLNKNFFMLGALPKKQIPAWHSATDLCTALFTGPRIVWKDAVQNKFFDSMAAGKPIINNFVGWQSELAEKYGAGVIVSPDDIESAGKKVLEVVADKEWLKQAGKSAKALAHEQFSRDQLAMKLEKVLIEAVSSTQGPMGE